jgi:hypothetical protein
LALFLSTRGRSFTRISESRLFYAGGYTLCHNAFAKNGRLNTLVQRGIRLGCHVVLHGDTHKQRLAWLDSNVNELTDERVEHGHPVPLGDGIMLVNPGAYGQGDYCIIENAGDDNHAVCFGRQALVAHPTLAYSRKRF